MTKDEPEDDKAAAKQSPLALPPIRKGDANFNYSIEKYLDPNRPFKCDVCRESFTQKNILLVHYNSVSHLHRLKKTMEQQKKEQQQQPASNGAAEERKTPPQEKTPPKKGSALEALVGSMKGERAKEEEDEVKSFKCNICKVAYSQGSTLDIHIRSVLHQTRTSKLQELILTGQVDLTKPLIEQPDPQQLQDQHKKMINDMLTSPKSVNSTGSTNSQSSPNVGAGAGSSSPNSGGGRTNSPQSSPLASLQQALAAGGKPDPTSSPEDHASSSAAAAGPLGAAFPFLAGLSPQQERKEGGEDGKAEPSPVLKNLLQNYGLEMVKQLGDLQKKKEEEEKKEEEDAKTGNLSDVQEALQKAMIQAQLQQMNPMLMQMSQLQNLNPLLAMNLHPPLIPPALLKSAGAGPELPAALIAQIQKQQQQQQPPSAAPPPPLGLLDPKLLALMAAGKQGAAGAEGSAPPPPPPFSAAGGLDPKQLPPPFPGAQPLPLPGQNAPPPPMPDPKALLMQQQPIPNPGADQGKRARTRITDDQLKVLRSNFDINNSPTEEALIRMAGQTGLPMKVIKHWFRNTLFKERQKNKDSPYNFSNPPSTKLNLEEYEKTGEPKVTPLNPEDQAEYVKESSALLQNSSSSSLKKENKESSDSSVKSELPVKTESPVAVAVAADAMKSGRSESPAAMQTQPPNATTPTNTVPKLNESSSENSLTLSRLLSSQLGGPGALPHPGAGLLPNFPAFPNVAAAAAAATSPGVAAAASSPVPPPPTSLANMPDYLNSLANRLPGSSADQSPRPSSPQSVSSGKRANRTRFTDYQIKVLQEFFENNAYPKDDDLEYLSKLLSLSPRVIVVWFQNARQKARKIYENQPPSNETAPGGAGGEGEDSGRFTRTPGCNYQCKKCLLVFQRYYELIRHQKQHCYKEEDAKRSAQAQKAAAQAAAQFAASSAGGSLPPPPASEDSNSSVGNSNAAVDRPGPGGSISPAAMAASAAAAGICLPNAPDDLVKSEAEKRQELAEMSKDAVNRLFGNAPFLPGTPFGLLQQQALQQQHLQQAIKPQQDGAAGGGESDELDSESLASSPSSKRKLSEDGDHDDDGTGHRDKRIRTSIQPPQLDALYQKYQQESNPSRRQLEQIAAEVGLRKRVVQVWFQNARARERKGLFVRPEEELVQGSGNCGGNDRPAPPESPFTVSDHIASLIPNSTSAFNLQSSMRKYYEDTMKRFMSDIQDANAAAAAAGGAKPPAVPVPISLPSAVIPPLPPSATAAAAEPALDLTSDAGDNSSDHLDDSEANRSIDADGPNGPGSAGGAGSGGSGGERGNKRFRTQMSGLQVKMMKAVFEVYKTPTMTECSSLGQDIGLQKRVVQVWFQNARAKEKRAKLQLQQATGQEPEAPAPPEECTVCGDFKYSHKFAVQDHIFTRAHLDNLRAAIEAGRYDPESPGQALSQTAAVLQNNGSAVPASGEENSNSLQMLQMSAAAATTSSTPASPQVNNRELLDAMANAHQSNPRMLMQV